MRRRLHEILQIACSGLPQSDPDVHRITTGCAPVTSQWNRKAGIWEAWGLHFDILGLHLGTLGQHFDEPEVPRDTQQDTFGSRCAFE